MNTTNVGTRTIELTMGYTTVVDEADYAQLSKWSWRALVRTNNVYAVRFERRSETGRQKRRMIYMHRQILGLRPGDPEHVDHANRDGLDNRRMNLRICTRSQNLGNVGGRGGSSKYKGVQFRKYRGNWTARIGGKKNSRFLGVFDDEINAGRFRKTEQGG